MKKNWVDFKAIKEAVTMQDVLDRYQVTGHLRKIGDEMRGACPIHDTDPRGRSFSANLTKNAFSCFTCKAAGNVLDFVAKMERCPVRDAALKLRDWFKVGDSQSSKSEQLENKEAGVEVQLGIYEDPSGGRYEVIATAVRLDDLQELVVFRELFEEFQFWVASPETFDQNSVNDASDSARRFTLIKAL